MARAVLTLPAASASYWQHPHRCNECRSHRCQPHITCKCQQACLPASPKPAGYSAADLAPAAQHCLRQTSQRTLLTKAYAEACMLPLLSAAPGGWASWPGERAGTTTTTHSVSTWPIASQLVAAAYAYIAYPVSDKHSTQEQRQHRAAISGGSWCQLLCHATFAITAVTVPSGVLRFIVRVCCLVWLCACRVQCPPWSGMVAGGHHLVHHQAAADAGPGHKC